VQTLTHHLITRGLANRVLTEAQLARLLSGSRQRRYHLINRATNAGELHRLRRGLFVLDPRLRTYPVHPFALAQAFEPGSYVSLETALAYHGWIPEAVRMTASITPGRKSSTFEHDIYGTFTFHPLAIQRGYFLELVERLQIDQQAMLVARPARALMDLVCLRKVEWQGLDWIVEGLRIDTENLRMVTGEEIRTLELVYRQKRVKNFLRGLAKELALD
jgi:predicted transcriptional regulator of viral defense system